MREKQHKEKRKRSQVKVFNLLEKWNKNSFPFSSLFWGWFWAQSYTTFLRVSEKFFDQFSDSFLTYENFISCLLSERNVKLRVVTAEELKFNKTLTTPIVIRAEKWRLKQLLEEKQWKWKVFSIFDAIWGWWSWNLLLSRLPCGC